MDERSDVPRDGEWGPAVLAHHGLIVANNPKTTLSLILSHEHLAYLALGTGHQSITAKQLLNGDLNVRASCLAGKLLPGGHYTWECTLHGEPNCGRSAGCGTPAVGSV